MCLKILNKSKNVNFEIIKMPKKQCFAKDKKVLNLDGLVEFEMINILMCYE